MFVVAKCADEPRLAVLRGNGMFRHVRRWCDVICTKTAEPIEMPFSDVYYYYC